VRIRHEFKSLVGGDSFKVAEAPFDPSLTVFIKSTGVEVDLDFENLAALADLQSEIDRDSRDDIESVQWEIPYADLVAYVLDNHRLGKNGPLAIADEDRPELVALALALETAAAQLRSALSGPVL
jgi:hypothetical protein